jgi:glucosamine-6-phosphate deaminase
MAMRIVLAKSTQEAVETVTSMVLDRLSSSPTSVLGLATGKTMEPVYEGLVKRVKEDRLQIEKNFFFMLDEYLGISDQDAGSFKTYIKSRLMNPLELHESQFAFPPVHSQLIDHAGAEYERLVKESGGIDLQLLGIGVNGHIGFNEPGSTKESRTRVVNLSPATLKANQNQFENRVVPAKALSMGIGTILEARELVMLATGESKAEAIKYLFNHHDDETCPATFLKSHPHFVLVLDPGAASKISLKI